MLIKDLCFAHLHPYKKIILQGREFVRLGFVDVSMIGMADISSTGISEGVDVIAPTAIEFLSVAFNGFCHSRCS